MLFQGSVEYLVHWYSQPFT
ncbi:rCG24472 [Rattus norvegicus]|uniref:RCG24472 n=1 Tax=Rattus norvegicus TaxID=10116 RepID=A6KJA4_RAT|nr:rCG24472 [Rattus norvegicus]